MSVTDGRDGHHEQGGSELVEHRRAKTSDAPSVAGIEYEILDNPNERLEPTLEKRDRVSKLIRECDPAVALTHRPNNPHPDHRVRNVVRLDVLVDAIGIETLDHRDTVEIGIVRRHMFE
ncbi:PIG-L deacetylase family protein [Halomontanus rarus]|uniref:PIG-L deacetylase family protein n=1 Tax=Halomontanus rarus TaxID=3034020 RepID=UPI003CE4508C